MILRSVIDIFDTFIKHGLDKVLLQKKTNLKGHLSYCLRASLINGFPIEVDPKMAEEFIRITELQYGVVKGFRLEDMGSQEVDRRFFKLVRIESGHEEAYRAMSGE